MIPVVVKQTESVHDIKAWKQHEDLGGLKLKEGLFAAVEKDGAMDFLTNVSHLKWSWFLFEESEGKLTG